MFSWDDFAESVPMTILASSDPSGVTVYHCYMDLKVGRYWYYYRLAYEEDVINDVDEERVTAVNNEMKMNNVRVHASDRVNGEAEQQEWDERERSKIESTLRIQPKIEDPKKVAQIVEEEDEKEGRKKEREAIALTEEERETLLRFERRRAEKEAEKQREQQERAERIQLSEIEQKVANRR